MQSLELYAQANVGRFFPAHNQTPADGNLTGQCVTLEKWIFQDFTSIPNPFAARGDARYLGINLVNQGLAVEVSAANAKPGDTVCYEYGQYGHTGTLLSGNRLFQQNVNLGGAKRRVLADGTVVYSAIIIPLFGSLGGVAPKFYRLKSFKEGVTMTDDQIVRTCLYMRLAAGQSVEQANANSANDLKQIKANIDYLPALAKQIYEGNELFRWKAAHYDEQVKAAYDKGVLDGEAGGESDFEAVAEVNGVSTLFTKKPKQ